MNVSRECDSGRENRFAFRARRRALRRSTAAWLGLLAVSMAAPGRAVQRIDHIEQFDFKPPEKAGAVDIVTLTVPEIDALKDLRITARPSKNGKTFMFRNTSKRVLFMYRYVFSRTATGIVKQTFGDDGIVDPGPDPSVIKLEYDPVPHSMPVGSFRALVVVVYRDKFFTSPTSHELTAAGASLVNLLRGRLDKAIDAEEKRTTMEARGGAR
jgi:hypothetical protein